MARGGFKVMVNGQLIRTHSIEADFDEKTVVLGGRLYGRSLSQVDFKNFFVSTVTDADMDEATVGEIVEPEGENVCESDAPRPRYASEYTSPPVGPGKA